MIPVADPVISKHAKRYVLASLRDGWISSRGPYVSRFEEAFADFIGAKFAVATNSGTSALHLALAALEIRGGDEVIVPALTMVATVLPILYVGATPVLVDVEADSGNIDYTKIEAAITKKTRAVIPVHLHGHPVHMDPLVSIARNHSIAVIEDAAEAHGATYKGTVVGSIGDIGCFSFYANKIVTTGEGGMAVTNNKKLADRMRSLANLARAPGKHYLHTEVGFAYRMGSLQAALGLGQLKEVDRAILKKREIARVYEKLLMGIDGITLPSQKTYAQSVWWQYGILLANQKSRDKVASYLADHEIETRTFFVPLHLQPAFSSIWKHKRQQFPVAYSLGRSGLCLPSGLSITEKQIEYICTKLAQALKTS